MKPKDLAKAERKVNPSHPHRVAQVLRVARKIRDARKGG